MTEIRYAQKDGLHVAYRVDGIGPIDLVFVSNWVSDIEQLRDVPMVGAGFRRMESFARVLAFDQPGTGHSDPIFGETPSLETFAGTIGIVMDAVGIERAALFAFDTAAAPAIMFAASNPDRVSALVIAGGSPRWTADDGYPGTPLEASDDINEAFVSVWGKPAMVSFLAPSIAQDEAASEAVARWIRSSLSPGAARRMFQMVQRFDVRPLLPSVMCPTLVLHSEREVVSRLDHAQYLAEHIPDARLEMFDSADHFPCQPDHIDWFYGELQAFLTGTRPEPPVDDRVFATVLFTDIVASTERAAEVGDKRWRELLDQHDSVARQEIERFRGRFVNTTGDGVLATFDGPARAIRCARAITEAMRRFGFEVRAGIHAGEVETRGEDIAGIAVHIGGRVSSMAGAGEVLVSSTVKDLVVGSGIEFEDRGSHELKGVPGEWRIYSVAG